MEDIKIGSILSKGIAIKTQIQDSRDWIANTIVNIYETTDEIEIIFDDRYLNMLVLVGDAIKISYREKEWEYLIDALITSIKLDEINIITLKVVNIKKLANLRKDERYSVNYGSTIFSVNLESGVFAVITNISVSGLAFVTRENFMIGEVIKISIMLPTSSFNIDAEIVRSTENIKNVEYGVRFLRNDDDALREITLLIDNIKEREDRLSHIVGFNTL